MRKPAAPPSAGGNAPEENTHTEKDNLINFPSRYRRSDTDNTQGFENVNKELKKADNDKKIQIISSACTTSIVIVMGTSALLFLTIVFASEMNIFVKFLSFFLFPSAFAICMTIYKIKRIFELYVYRSNLISIKAGLWTNPDLEENRVNRIEKSIEDAIVATEAEIKKHKEPDVALMKLLNLGLVYLEKRLNKPTNKAEEHSKKPDKPDELNKPN